MTKSNISSRQFAILYAMAMTAPAILTVPTFIAGRAKNDCWISVLIGAVTGILTILLSNYIVRRKSGSIGEICNDILSKPITKIILLAYLLWGFMLVSFFIRSYAERIVSTLLPNCTIEFVYLFMFILLAFSLKNGLASSARMINYIFMIFGFVFIALSLLNIFGRFDYQNMLPVFSADLVDILHSAAYCGGFFCMIFFMYFFFDEVNADKNITKLSLQALAFLTLFSLITVLSTVGTIGYGAVGKMSFPYFEVIKNISVFTKLSRFDALLYSIWIVSDFSVIFLFSYVCMSITKNLFLLTDKLNFALPTLLIGFALSELIYKNQFIMENVAKNILLIGSLILCTVLPLLLIIVGKIRKKL